MESEFIDLLSNSSHNGGGIVCNHGSIDRAVHEITRMTFHALNPWRRGAKGFFLNGRSVSTNEDFFFRPGVDFLLMFLLQRTKMLERPKPVSPIKNRLTRRLSCATHYNFPCDLLLTHA